MNIINMFEELNLVGGSLSVDFANTIECGIRYKFKDWLEDYQDLVRWTAKAGAVTDLCAHKLLKYAAKNPDDAQSVFEKSGELRATIRAALVSIEMSTPVDDVCLDALNRFAGEALQARCLVAHGDEIHWHWVEDPIRLDRPLWPIAMDICDLLTEDRLAFLKRCNNPACSWMFVDTSKNKTRRWCEMEVCGNQAKSRRHYAKKKA